MREIGDNQEKVSIAPYDISLILLLTDIMQNVKLFEPFYILVLDICDAALSKPQRMIYQLLF